MKPERPVLGCLGALLFALPAAPLTWLLARSDVYLGLVGLVGYLLSLGGYCLLGGRSSDFGRWFSVLPPLPAALPGLYYSYAELIYEENRRFGCTMREALELVPSVALDPGNRGELLWDLGGILLLDLLCALLLTKYLRSQPPKNRE